MRFGSETFIYSYRLGTHNIGALRGNAILTLMTFMSVSYELQDKLKPEQFRALGMFANTYGLQRFRVDEKSNILHFDYDASRLRENVVEHVLREARIPVLRRVAQA